MALRRMPRVGERITRDGDRHGTIYTMVGTYKDGGTIVKVSRPDGTIHDGDMFIGAFGDGTFNTGHTNIDDHTGHKGGECERCDAADKIIESL